MEKYLKAVSEMYSQFKKFEAHPMVKYIGRLANCRGVDCEVVGYRNGMDDTWALIVDGAKIKGWCWKVLDTRDIVFKDCEYYFYVSIDDLID